MSNERLGVDISKNYGTWGEALDDLYEDHEKHSNISKIFTCLRENTGNKRTTRCR